MTAKNARVAIVACGIALYVAADARAQSGEPAVQPETSVHTQPNAGAASVEKSVATKLQNPIADLISVPLQNNFDVGAGPGDPLGYTLDIQPVIPFPLGRHVRMLSRTIVPAVIDQPEIVPGTGRKIGLGDITQSLFFSPAQEGTVIWGIGPVIVLPTATHERLGSGQWSAGPTAVFLAQAHGWTAGALVNHVWSFTGDEDRRDVSTTFLQPFFSYTFRFGFSITAQTETTFDWEAKQWTIPIALGVSQVVKFGELPVSIGVFVRDWVEGSAASPDWGIRVPITFVLPGFTRPPAPPAAPPPRSPVTSKPAPGGSGELAK